MSKVEAMTHMADVTGFVKRTKWRKKSSREHLGTSKRNVDKAITWRQLESENMEYIVINQEEKLPYQ